MMIDFASGLYLGLRHPAREAGDYAALTTGHPAALAASPLMRPLAAQAAALQGAQAGLVGTSTLHLAIDAFERLGRSHALFADDALYPVMRWAAERMLVNHPTREESYASRLRSAQGCLAGRDFRLIRNKDDADDLCIGQTRLLAKCANCRCAEQQQRSSGTFNVHCSPQFAFRSLTHRSLSASTTQ